MNRGDHGFRLNVMSFQCKMNMLIAIMVTVIMVDIVL